MNTTIRIKLLRPDAKPPSYATDGSSGLDLVALEGVVIYPGATVKVPLGFAVELQPGYEAQIRPRSGKSLQGIHVHLGTIDSDYRGEVCAILTNLRQDTGWPAKRPTFDVHPGDKIAQLVIAPVERVMLMQVDELSETVRGEGGFGHTGR